MIRDTVLDNILSSKGTKRIGRIVKPLGHGKYQVQDSQGHMAEVESNVLWGVGAGVTVRDGFVVGKSSGKVVQKVYQV